MIIRQITERYKNIYLTRRAMYKFAVFSIFIYALYQGTFYFKTHDYFPITEVNIIGANFTNHEELQQVLKPLVNRGFFIVDVEQIKSRLLQFPWVLAASVRRVWPQKLDIEVIEKKSLARWNNTSLVSTTGEIFSPLLSSFPTQLPLFKGPSGSQMQMLNYYDILSGLLLNLGFKISELELTSAGAWHMILSNGIKVNVGYKDILTRMNHFVKVYPKIVGERASEVEYVDLRYPNGLAIRWKT